MKKKNPKTAKEKIKNTSPPKKRRESVYSIPKYFKM